MELLPKVGETSEKYYPLRRVAKNDCLYEFEKTFIKPRLMMIAHDAFMAEHLRHMRDTYNIKISDEIIVAISNLRKALKNSTPIVELTEEQPSVFY